MKNRMLRKFGAVYLVILAAVLMSVLYGILHDQITYSISQEYYTKFKFYQFGLENYFHQSPRLGVTIVGFQATWWMGLMIGIVIALVSFLHRQPKQMLQVSLKALGVVLLVTVLVPVVCVPIYFWEDFFSNSPVPYALVEPDFTPSSLSISNTFTYVVVGTIHNFSYLGGLIGLVAGIIYHIWSYKKPANVLLATN
ncbi:MAG: hypothetical protein ACO1OQ_15595 [Rufibacter sp.]